MTPMKQKAAIKDRIALTFLASHGPGTHSELFKAMQGALKKPTLYICLRRLKADGKVTAIKRPCASCRFELVFEAVESAEMDEQPSPVVEGPVGIVPRAIASKPILHDWWARQA